MNFITNIVTNQWVIGIGSSIIVYFITNFIVSKRKDKLYKQKIEMANSEMLHSLKPMVSSEEKINLEYYDSIAGSLATKHGVEKDDLYSFEFVIDNVITEIMRSQFLSYKQKKEFCNRLLNAKKQNLEEEESIKGKTKTSKNNEDGISTKDLSLVVATMTALYSIVSLSMLNERGLEVLNFIEEINVSFPVFLIIIPVISLMSTRILHMLKRNMKKEKKNKIEMNEKKEKDNKSENSEGK